MFDQLPDWVPFACLMVKNPVTALRKSMIARVIEALIISAASAFAAVVIGLPYALNDVHAEIDKQKTQFSEHIKWSENHVASRNLQIDQMARSAEKDRAEIKHLVLELNRCLRERTCTK